MEVYLRDPSLRLEHGRAGRARMLREFGTEPLCAAFVAEWERRIAERHAPRERRNFAGRLRRAFDVIIALLLLLITAPVMLLIAIAVQANMGSPVLFRQLRIGRHEKPFTLHKFRTMHAEQDAEGKLLSPEARLTRVGRWLRSTSLDELPELWDVLRGHMSLVGPRPLLPQYLPLYSERQAQRHEVTPGITGWAQVHGRNGIDWDQKLELDAWYVDHASPLLDLQILLRTIPQVMGRRGVSPPDGVLMEPFHGQRS
jgi:lipopolysaccharide/colanic/teichoic acid biosynthesis glycosyltransferase